MQQGVRPHGGKRGAHHGAQHSRRSLDAWACPTFEQNQVRFDVHQNERPKLIIRLTAIIDLNAIDRKDYRWQGSPRGVGQFLSQPMYRFRTSANALSLR